MNVLSRTAVSMAWLTALAACTKPEDARKTDPNLPAIVQAPPIILPSDTARPDTMPEYRDRMEAARPELMREYSVMAAAAVFGDRPMLSSIYSPAVTLRLGDSTHTGRAAATVAVINFFQRSGIVELIRQSDTLNAIDSVYTDSGNYLMVAKRPGAAESHERGRYVAKWRLMPRGPRWSLLSDELTPDPATKKP